MGKKQGLQEERFKSSLDEKPTEAEGEMDLP